MSRFSLRKFAVGTKRKRIYLVIALAVFALFVIAGYQHSKAAKKKDILVLKFRYLERVYNEGFDGFKWGSKIEDVKSDLAKRETRHYSKEIPNWEWTASVYYRKEFEGIKSRITLEFILGRLHKSTVWFEGSESLFERMNSFAKNGLDCIAITNWFDQSRIRRIKYYTKYTEVFVFERIDVAEPVRFIRYRLRRPGRSRY